MTDERTAVWLGGPFDGQTMTLLEGMDSVEVMDREQLRDEVDVELVELLEDDPAVGPLRVCPVRSGPDGRLVIDWHAGTTTR